MSRPQRHAGATWRGWWQADEGRVTAFVVVLVTAILALAGLTLDGGLALAAKVRANGEAEAAARAGAQAIDLTAYRNTGAMQLIPAQAVADGLRLPRRRGRIGNSDRLRRHRDRHHHRVSEHSTT